MIKAAEAKDAVKKGCQKSLCALAKTAHKSEHPIHLLYFLAVSTTAHGAYAYVAAICLVVGVLVMIPIGAIETVSEEEDA